MSTKHTPGPWGLAQVEDGNICQLVPIDAEGVSLLTVVYEQETAFAAVYNDADARLIASAPNLLKALTALVAEYEGYFEGAPDSPALVEARAVIVEARAVIVEATGQEGAV